MKLFSKGTYLDSLGLTLVLSIFYWLGWFVFCGWTLNASLMTWRVANCVDYIEREWYSLRRRAWNVQKWMDDTMVFNRQWRRVNNPRMGTTIHVGWRSRIFRFGSPTMAVISIVSTFTTRMSSMLGCLQHQLWELLVWPFQQIFAFQILQCSFYGFTTIRLNAKGITCSSFSSFNKNSSTQD